MTEKTTTAKATTYYATRGFKDAGTERTFVGGKPLENIDEDTARNYAAAGLASTDKPDSTIAG